MQETYTLTGLKTREYLSKYPTASDNAIAKMLCKEFPSLYASHNSARLSVMFHQGKTKNGSGNYCKTPIKRNSDFTRENPKGRRLIKNINAKILILDIETSPIQGYIWGLHGEMHISKAQVIKDWYVITWAAKWLFGDKVYGGKITGREAIKGDDKRIMKSVWEMMNRADVIIWHNGDRFDYRKLNTRFLIHGMDPVLPFISIDTLKHSRKIFSHSSNKLDDLNGDLKLRQKVEHEGFPLWKACDNGDEKAIKRMFDYNTGDIFAEEDLYLRMRQWIKPHPNIALHITDEKAEQCPTCTSTNLKAERKGYFTKTARYDLFRCNDCGAVGRQRVTSTKKERAPYLKVSV